MQFTFLPFLSSHMWNWHQCSLECSWCTLKSLNDTECIIKFHFNWVLNEYWGKSCAGRPIFAPITGSLSSTHRPVCLNSWHKQSRYFVTTQLFFASKAPELKRCFFPSFSQIFWLLPKHILSLHVAHGTNIQFRWNKGNWKLQLINSEKGNSASMPWLTRYCFAEQDARRWKKCSKWWCIALSVACHVMKCCTFSICSWFCEHQWVGIFLLHHKWYSITWWHDWQLLHPCMRSPLIYRS